MPAGERTLLDNVLDCLDRLYDKESGPIDVKALCTATANAVQDPAWVAALESAANGLGQVMRSGAPAEEQYKDALTETHDLRLMLAEFYQG
jgi:hypothetical protein